MEETASIETITPKWAREVLVKHEKQIENEEIRQRSLSDGTVEKYANDMRHGHWFANNQGIGFDDKDNLVDGRHRLWAVVRSGITVRMLVVRGMKDFTGNGVVIKPIFTIDGGRPRSVGAQLQLDGVKYASQTASALRSMALLCTRRDQVKLSVASAKSLLRVFEKDLDRVFESVRHNTTFMKGYITGTVALYRTVEPDKADEFIDSFYTGQDLPEGSPVLALKNYIRTNKGKGGGTDSTVRAGRATALALMHYNNNVKVGIIRNSTLGTEWLIELAKKSVKKMRTILGDDGEEEQAAQVEK